MEKVKRTSYDISGTKQTTYKTEAGAISLLKQMQKIVGGNILTFPAGGKMGGNTYLTMQREDSVFTYWKNNRGTYSMDFFIDL